MLRWIWHFLIGSAPKTPPIPVALPPEKPAEKPAALPPSVPGQTLSLVKGPTELRLTYAIPIVAAAFIVQDHRKTPYDSEFNNAGRKWNVDLNLLRAIARKENAKFDRFA